MNAPLLPTADAMQLWLHLGWSVVLAWLAVRWVPRRPGLAALLAALWAWAPGTYSPVYWLGLAFQAPSAAAVLLCLGLLWERWQPALPTPTARLRDRRVLALSLLGVLAGWALLLDTAALLPWSIYAWGLGPQVVGLITLVALLPWAWGPAGATAFHWRLMVVPLAVLVFVVWRLPSGNIWDAVLDPWLWLVLQVQWVRAGLVSYKK